MSIDTLGIIDYGLPKAKKLKGGQLIAIDLGVPVNRDAVFDIIAEAQTVEHGYKGPVVIARLADDESSLDEGKIVVWAPFPERDYTKELAQAILSRIKEMVGAGILDVADPKVELGQVGQIVDATQFS